MAQFPSSNRFSFWQNPLVGGIAGALAAILIAGLSAFAMRRLGQEMDWVAVLSGGAAGGLAGHGVLRGVLLWLDRTKRARSPMDRFAWMVLSGLVTSMVLGVVLFAVIFRELPVGADGSRVLGPRLFVMIGWLVGILASSLPLAIVELQREDSSKVNESGN
jgi:hypothetical protein